MIFPMIIGILLLVEIKTNPVITRPSILQLRAMGEASSLSFGLWFFRHQYNSSSWGILRDKEGMEERALEEEELQYSKWGLSKSMKLELITLLFLFLLNIMLTIFYCVCYMQYGKT